MVGNGMGARHGIMFKTAVSLEETGKTEIVALDKTGTITSGEPRVTDLIPAEGVDERQLLELALALEKKSEHPLARAVLARAKEWGLKAADVTDFKALPGNGLSAVLDGALLCGGNLAFIGGQAEIDLILPQYILENTMSCQRPTALEMQAASPAARERLPEPPLPRLGAVTREELENALEVCGQNRTKAAKYLGISRRTIYRKLEEYALSNENQASLKK